MKKREIYVGGVKIGGDAPVSVQSMTNTDSRDLNSTVAQIKRLQAVGCEIVRVTMPDMDAVANIKPMLKQIDIPLIADIHFKHALAIESLKAGASCVRINPGNIGGREKTLEVIAAAKDTGGAIRVGVNAGSLEKDLLKEYGVSAQSLVLSAIRQCEILESVNFTNYKVSIKASNVPMTVEAYKKFSELSPAPLHIGVTEAGTLKSGVIKSSIGIGALLLMGIGNTMRVSLTAPPEEEVKTAWSILAACGLRQRGVNIISCPTCGRTEIDLISLAEKVEERLMTLDKKITVAVMGCVVNGPGEAKEADFGIAAGRGNGLIFRKGEIVKKVNEDELLEELMNIIEENC